jgi:hypothetical protein
VQLKVLKTCLIPKLLYCVHIKLIFNFIATPFFHFKQYQPTQQDYRWKWHKLLVGLQQTSGLEKEGKAAKLTVTTFVYCSTRFFILWRKGRMSALCFPYQDHDFCLLFYLFFYFMAEGENVGVVLPLPRP